MVLATSVLEIGSSLSNNEQKMAEFCPKTHRGQNHGSNRFLIGSLMQYLKRRMESCLVLITEKNDTLYQRSFKGQLSSNIASICKHRLPGRKLKSNQEIKQDWNSIDWIFLERILRA